MDEAAQQHRVIRAREVLRTIHHIPIATVNADGSPHSSPVLMAFDDTLHGFWASSPESAHSHNIARDARVFLSIFDSKEGHSGLFLSGSAQILTDTAALSYGFEQLKALKEQLYGSIGDISAYMPDAPQRIYEFVPVKAWVNHSDKQGDVIVRDQRYEISLQELLKKKI